MIFCAWENIITGKGISGKILNTINYITLIGRLGHFNYFPFTFLLLPDNELQTF